MIGIDILEIERVNNLKENKLKKIFVENEINYINKFHNKNERIAGFFCAKEAIIKAFGQSLNFLDIEISHNENNKPIVIFHNNAKKLFEKNYKKIDISISHTKTVATAICQLID